MSEEGLGGYDEEQALMMSEECIQVDENDRVIGPLSKRKLHLWENIKKSMLHRAFSVFLIDCNNRLLLQQRAGTKITFPLFWANTCCSHPWHNKDEMELENALGVKRAAVRKLNQELGIDPDQIPLDAFQFLTRIHYKARNGETEWGEHEIDHVLILRPPKDVVVKPNPNEVESTRWVSADDLNALFQNSSMNGDLIAPWFELISKTFLLPKWWGKLNEISQGGMKDEQIHRLEL
jgi:isopentenyl-diphosphate Delta-isomerase